MYNSAIQDKFGLMLLAWCTAALH